LLNISSSSDRKLPFTRCSAAFGRSRFDISSIVDDDDDDDDTDDDTITLFELLEATRGVTAVPIELYIYYCYIYSHSGDRF